MNPIILILCITGTVPAVVVAAVNNDTSISVGLILAISLPLATAMASILAGLYKILTAVRDNSAATERCTHRVEGLLRIQRKMVDVSPAINREHRTMIHRAIDAVLEDQPERVISILDRNDYPSPGNSQHPH